MNNKDVVQQWILYFSQGKASRRVGRYLIRLFARIQTKKIENKTKWFRILNAKCTTRISMRPYHVHVSILFLPVSHFSSFGHANVFVRVAQCDTALLCFSFEFTLPIAFVRSASVKDTPSYLLLIFYIVESVYNQLWITNCVFDRRRYTLISFLSFVQRSI